MSEYDPMKEAARLTRFREIALAIQSHPVDANEDELMRMVRIADEVDAQWREAVVKAIEDLNNLPLGVVQDASYVLRGLRDLGIKTGR